MNALLDPKRVEMALNELNSPEYDKLFKDPIARKTRGHMSATLRLFLEKGLDALDMTYRKQKVYASEMGSSSLMLGLFLLSLDGDDAMGKSGYRVYSELYKQWGEFPFYGGLMFGFSLIGVVRQKFNRVVNVEILTECERILREFCENGKADRGLTCLWIMLRGYIK